MDAQYNAQLIVAPRLAVGRLVGQIHLLQKRLVPQVAFQLLKWRVALNGKQTEACVGGLGLGFSVKSSGAIRF